LLCCGPRAPQSPHPVPHARTLNHLHLDGATTKHHALHARGKSMTNSNSSSNSKKIYLQLFTYTGEAGRWQGRVAHTRPLPHKLWGEGGHPRCKKGPTGTNSSSRSNSSRREDKQRTGQRAQPCERTQRCADKHPTWGRGVHATHTQRKRRANLTRSAASGHGSLRSHGV
jgi:hypothetical protein